MIYEQKNWSLMDLTQTDRVAKIQAEMAEVKDGDTIIGGNLSQFAPDTVMFEGVKNLTVIDCNTVNCKFDATTKRSSGNVAKIEFEYAEEEIEGAEAQNLILKDPIPTTQTVLKMKEYKGKQEEGTEMTKEERKAELGKIKFKNKGLKEQYEKEIK